MHRDNKEESNNKREMHRDNIEEWKREMKERYIATIKNAIEK